MSPVTDKLKEGTRTSSPEPNISCIRAQPYPNLLADRQVTSNLFNDGFALNHCSLFDL